jgi:glyoxylase-like metal-dependent hydrolase (beta-lactamase superfamily II)
VSLTLEEPSGNVASRNFYWLSARPETLDWEKSTWYHTPTKTFADYTALSSLPEVDLEVTAQTQTRESEGTAAVTVRNPGRTLAFAVHLKVKKGPDGEEVLPVLWEDNYFPLLPGESRRITATYNARDLGKAAATVEAEGWNVRPKLAANAAMPQAAPLAVEALRGGVYWVKGGSGANTGFIVGTKEVIVIDAKMTEDSARAELAEIRKLTANPVKYIVLTHSDGDHVNGLSAFPKGLPILAHTNTRKDMEQAFQDPKMSALLPYLPNDVAPGDRPIDIDGVRVSLLYFGPAHTSGDLVVFLPDQKIAFVGDLAFIGRDPLIHRQKGGTSFGLVRTLNRILALDADTLISGHSDPLTKADIRALVASIEEKQAKVKAMLEQKKSLDEIRAAFGATGDPAARRFPSLAEIIFQELTEKK